MTPNGMETRVERINPYLEVKDLAASMRYYSEVLGFDVYIEVPTLGILTRDGHQIHIIPRDGELNPGRVWIGVEDIAPLHKGYLSRGAVIRKGPTNTSWAYQMEVEDLDGNTLIFGSGPLDGVPFED